ncbi:MAG: 3',5'-cyclic-AMP phosphodiesterase [Pseudomonadota bacterium]|nr:3',5'-cyclic-AMP phosphodiesterase [Pseudomonadota bacterium]
MESIVTTLRETEMPRARHPQPLRPGKSSRETMVPKTKSGTLRLLQLTDTHLFADAETRLLGQNTRRTFELVLELAFDSFWPADMILLTGDLVQDESPEGYQYLDRLLARLDTPCHCLPGNHDECSTMFGMFGSGAIDTSPTVDWGAWNLVLLDSTVPEDDHGHLDRSELELLDEALTEYPDSHALVCLHHQPIPVGSAWMDTMALDNPEDFFALIDRHPQVRGVLWGHVHQEFTGYRNDVLMLGSPSTCFQFLPGSGGFAVDTLTPGFRWLELHPNGRISTGIERIAAYPDPVDLTTDGY